MLESGYNSMFTTNYYIKWLKRTKQQRVFFALSLCPMQHDQQDDKVFIADVEKKIQQNPNQYTWKKIDSIKLIHKFNRL